MKFNSTALGMAALLVTLLSSAVLPGSVTAATPPASSFSDDFDDDPVGTPAKGWTTCGGTWAVKCVDNNQNFIFAVDSGDRDKALISVPKLHDFTLEGFVQMRDLGGEGGLLFSVSQIPGTDAFLGYELDVHTNHTVTLSRNDSSSRTVLQTAQRIIDTDVPYHLRVQRSGKLLKVFVNGYLLLAVTDNTYPTCERIGLQGGTKNRVYFDRILFQPFPDPPAPPIQSMAAFTYTNNIRGTMIRDAQILEVDGTYFMSGTSTVFFPDAKDNHLGGISPGATLYSSKNLLDWKFEKVIVERDPSRWYDNYFWAPEIHRINGKFYLTFWCDPCLGLAVADRIDGPYKVLNEKEGIRGAFDGSLFQDDDGKIYLFFGGVSASEIDLNTAQLVGEKFDCIHSGPKGTWDNGTEGSFVIKRNGIYYLFYSSWAEGYQVGTATATNVRGPWTKTSNSPVYGAQRKDNCERNGSAFTQNPAVPFSEVGHNAIFTGPDGRDWICCHAMLKHPFVPRLCFDPLTIANGLVTSANDGIIKKNGPTWTPQTVPIAK